MEHFHSSFAHFAYNLFVTAIDLTRACCAHELYDTWIGLHSRDLNGSRGIADDLFLAAVACDLKLPAGVADGADPFVVHENLADILMESKPLSREELQQAVLTAMDEAQGEEKLLPAPVGASQSSVNQRCTLVPTRSAQQQPEVA